MKYPNQDERAFGPVLAMSLYVCWGSPGYVPVCVLGRSWLCPCMCVGASPGYVPVCLAQL